MVCAGFPNAVEGLPDETTKEAAEGTAAHYVSDDCLSLGLDPYDFIGSKMTVGEWTFPWTVDDADFLAPGIDKIRGYGGEFYGEQRVDISEFTLPGQFGTLDRAVILPELIVIGDLKYGRGVPVAAVENKQLMLYALGFWHDIARHRTDAKRFRIIIDQPRHIGGGGEWEVSLDELLGFGERAKAAAKATLDPDAPRTASEKGCLWCRRKEAPGGCDTYEEFLFELLGVEFDDLDDAIEDDNRPIELSNVLTPERRSYLIQHRKLIERWLENMANSALEDATTGRPTPGLKAVDGRMPARKYKDDEVADALLRELLGVARFNLKLKSPTMVEKMIGKAAYQKFVDVLVDYGTAKPVLVPDADARPALSPVADQFEDLD